MKYLVVVLVCIQSLSFSQELFQNPLNIPMYLSGSFAELRSNHFHSGIDIKTKETVGFPVFSVQEGWVSRIKVSPWGYGLAIYINHPSGYTSVYGHLSEFNNRISELVLTEQYSRKSYAFDKYFKKNELIISKRDTIGFSGNSGSSGGPHLHFELRKSTNQKPVNPLLFNFNIIDTISPNFKKLILYQNSEKEEFRVSKQNNSYFISDTLAVSDNFRFGIVTNDRGNNSNSKLGINKIEYFLDESLMFSYENHQFLFSESRYINSFIDYDIYTSTKERVQKLFVDPGNKLSTYQRLGQYKSLVNNDIYEVRIIIFDSKNNRSELRFFIRSSLQITNNHSASDTDDYVLFKHNKDNYFKTNKVSVSIKKGALYSDLKFKYSVLEEKRLIGNEIYQIHNDKTPLHRSMKVKILVPQAIKDYKNKLTIVSKDGKGFSALKSHINDGFITTTTRQFGSFGLSIDTIPPVVKVLRVDFTRNNQNIIVGISDDLTGISSYEAYIDDQWVLMKYQYKRKRIYYDLDKMLVKTGLKRMLIVKVTDRVGNETIIEDELVY